MSNSTVSSAVACLRRKRLTSTINARRISKSTALVVAFACLLLARPAGAQSVWSAIAGTSVDTNWSSAANWTPAAVPSAATSVLFNNTTAVGGTLFNSVGDGVAGIVNPASVNNYVDTNFTIQSLVFTNVTANFQNTLIAPGYTLNVSSNLTVGDGSAAIDFGSAANQNVAIAGATSSLSVSNTNAIVWVSLGSASAAPAGCTLDLSGLGAFNAVVSKFLVSVPGENRPVGIVYLAATNTITAGFQTTATETSDTTATGAFIVGDTTSNNGGKSDLYLGQVNTINADTIIIGRQKMTQCMLQFNPNLVGGPGLSATIRGFSTSRVSVWTLGDAVVNTGTTTVSGVNDFSGGNVNALVNTLYLGRGANTTTGGGVSTGTLTFDNGIINVNNLYDGYEQAASGTKTGTGTVNVNSNSTLNTSATLVVNTNLYLADTAANTAVAGMLNINGGTVLANNILTVGGGTSAINMVGGLLCVSNAVGTATLPITTLSVNNSTLTLAVVHGANSVNANTLNVNGTADTINIASLPTTASFPTVFQVVKFGTLNGTYDFNLGTLPGTYQGYISNDTVNLAIDLVITNSAVKADVWNGNVNGNWDATTANWLYLGSAVNFQNGDFVTFSDGLAGTPNIVLTTNLYPGNIEVSNSVATYVFSGSGALNGVTGLTKDGTGSLTLAETGGDSFMGGVTVNSGTVILDDASPTNSGGLTISSGGTVQIGAGDTKGALPAGTVVDNGTLVFDQSSPLTVATAISGTGALTQSGGGILTLSAANTYTGNTTVQHGTLAVTAAGAITNSPQVSVASATLDESAISGTAILEALEVTNAVLDVEVPYLLPGLNVQSLGMGGSVNTINVAALPPIASYPTTETILVSAGGIAGYNAVLGTLPAASPAYVGTLSESADQTTIYLTLTAGPLGVRPTVEWSGANSNVDTNWSDALNWQSPGAPATTDNVSFSDLAAQSSLPLTGNGSGVLTGSSINNYVDTNFTVATLTYSNLNNDFQNTLIAPGSTLTVTSSATNSAAIMSVGSMNTDYGTAAAGYVTISGSNATLTVANPSAIFFVGFESAAGTSMQETLDLSALGTFTATVNSFAIGAIATTADDVSGNCYLAQTNVITATGGAAAETGQDETLSLMVGESGKGGGADCYLYLGQNNVFNVNGVGICLAKQNAEMEFNPALAGLNPVATFRGTNGTSPVAVWAIADGLAQTGSSTAPTGVADFTGGTVNASVTTMYIGRSPNVSGGHAATGTLTFGAGNINVTTLYDGYQPNNDTDFGAGTINANGPGSLVVGSLNLGFTTGSSGATSTTGTLNINGGSVSAGVINVGTNSVNTITMTGGSLTAGGSVGGVSNPLGTLSLTGSTLELAAGAAPAVTASTFEIDAQTTTTNLIDISAVGSIASVPVELPLISYTSFGYTAGGTFNLALGTLPSGYEGYLTNDTDNSLIGLVLTSAAPPLTSLAVKSISLSGANVVFNGTNQGTGTYYVLSSTNLTQSLSLWRPVATNVLSASGSFTLTATNAVQPQVPQQFYILSTTNN